MIHKTLVPDFLGLVDKHIDLVEHFLVRKESISKNDILALNENFTKGDIDSLVNRRILAEHNGLYSLDNRIVTLLEDIQEINDISIGTVRVKIQELEAITKVYKEDISQKHLKKIKIILRALESGISREILKLQNLLSETYKSEDNPQAKELVFKDLGIKRDDIDLSIQSIETYFDENEWMAVSGDIELTGLKIKLGFILNNDRKNLLEIQSQITEYLNKFQQERELYKKIQQLKKLKDQGLLQSKTDTKQVVLASKSLLFSVKPAIKIKVGIPYLESDEGRELIERVNQQLERRPPKKRRVAGSLTDDYDLFNVEQSHRFDVDKLFNRFLRQKKSDLFNFLAEYEFPQNIVLSPEKRISLYIQFSLEKDKNLTDREEYGNFTFTNVKNKKVSVHYLKIYPKNAR